jgi:hypothetical protein
MEEEIKQPIGKFIIENAISTQGSDGAYYHYSEVCRLLNLQQGQMYSEEEMIKFANFAKNYKSPREVIKAFEQFKK